MLQPIATAINAPATPIAVAMLILPAFPTNKPYKSHKGFPRLALLQPMQYKQV